MSESIKFTINIAGNAYSGIAEIDKAMGKLSVSANQSLKLIDRINQSAFKFNNISQAIQGVADGLNSTYQPGIALNKSLADLSAIAGVTGKGLKEIEGYARSSAKAFGVDAAQSVESYKLILSQLSPELAKTPTALRKMGDDIAVLSKTMGGDAAAAAEVLTTAMNQYQVSLSDPTKASEEMARMMNIMAAAGKEGSAELPTIKMALEQSGMAAKAAGVSFEELNGAIQVLDKAGRKGAEGGVAIRNALTILSQGRFMPDDVQKALTASGISVTKLGDSSIKLTDRLRMLKPVLQDTALFGKLFGRENVNAAMALVQGTDEVDRYTQAITNTNTAYEQARTIMDSYAERQARIKAQFDDIKISIFNATGNFGIWIQTIAQAMIPVSQLIPLMEVCGRGFIGLTSKWGVFVNFFRAGTVSALLNLGILKMSIVSAGGLFQFLKISAVSTLRAIGVAIMNIPIIGWIAAVIALLIWVFKTLWDKCEGFRRLLFGVWEVIKTGWKIIGDFVSMVISSVSSAVTTVWSWIKGFFSWLWSTILSIGSIIAKGFSPLVAVFKWIWDIVKKIFSWIVDKMAQVFKPIIDLWNKVTGNVSGVYNAGAKKGSESFLNSKKNDSGIADPQIPGIAKTTPEGVPQAAASAATSAVTGGTRNTQITINMGKFFDNIVFNGGFTENAKDIERKMQEMMIRILASAQSAG